MSQLPRLIRLVLSSFTVRTVVGVEGDVQPALPLAVERGKLGHAVRVCISPNFVAWAKSVGLDPVPMGVEKRMPSGKSGAMPTLTPDELRRLRESSSRPSTLVRAGVKHGQTVRDLRRGAGRIASGSDSARPAT